MSKPDQNDVVAENTRLKAELDAANKSLIAAGENATALQATIAKGEEQLASEKARADKAEAELKAAQSRIADLAADNEKLRSEAGEANARAARIVVSAGIVSGAKGEPANGAAAKPKTFTERCLEARAAAAAK